MDFFQWHWWAGLALLMWIAEIFVPGFFLLCLGIGCFGASAMAALGLGPSAQLLAFSLLSLVAFFTVRPVLMKRLWRGGDHKTNTDALIGRKAKVTQDFEPGLRLGRVAVDGDDWRAECTSDRTLHTGDIIRIVRVDSNTLIVEPLEP
jgi:membrane protein implicated in regulation of membrane protease activity